MEVEEAGLQPNQVTMVAVNAACADMVALDLGRRIHEYSSKSGFQRNVHISNTLIDRDTKCGCLKVARVVFGKMDE